MVFSMSLKPAAAKAKAGNPISFRFGAAAQSGGSSGSTANPKSNDTGSVNTVKSNDKYEDTGAVNPLQSIIAGNLAAMAENSANTETPAATPGLASTTTTTAPAPNKVPSVLTMFGADSDDDDEPAKGKGKGQPKATHIPGLSKEVRENMKKLEEELPDVFDYDSYAEKNIDPTRVKPMETTDVFVQKSRFGLHIMDEKFAEKMAASKPQYVDGMLQEKESREMERQILEQRRIDRELAEEGLPNKPEEFVTEAYAAELEKRKAFEANLKKQDELDRKEFEKEEKSVMGFGRNFHNTLLGEREAPALQKTASATAGGVGASASSGPSLILGPTMPPAGVVSGVAGPTMPPSGVLKRKADDAGGVDAASPMIGPAGPPPVKKQKTEEEVPHVEEFKVPTLADSKKQREKEQWQRYEDEIQKQKEAAEKEQQKKAEQAKEKVERKTKALNAKEKYLLRKIKQKQEQDEAG